MTEAIETENHGDTRIEIFYDDSPSSPREDTNLTRIIGWERNIGLSDAGQPSPRYIGEDYTPLEWWRSYINVDPDETDNRVPNINGVRVLFSAPLRLDDHGSNGVRLSILDWLDGDWARASGVIYVGEDAWDECMGSDEPKPTDAEGWVKLIEGEVETYQQYLNGEVYGYVVSKVTTCDQGFEHLLPEDQDSCWGFYSTDDALSEGRAAAGITDKHVWDKGVGA